MARLKIAAGNWKMHTTIDDGVALAKALVSGLGAGNQGIVIAPPFIHLSSIQNETGNTRIKLAAQNCNANKEGAFTGEVSAYMLAQIGIDYVIVGHSERREYFNESNEVLKEKVDAVLAEGIKCIFCCGEPLEIREAEGQQAYVRKQLEESLFHLSEAQLEDVVIAYEPIWAIGTGKTASPEQAQAMHAFIRGEISGKYSDDAADEMSILYGGSVKPANADALFSQPDVDGGLVGGASLKADSFLEIIRALG